MTNVPGTAAPDRLHRSLTPLGVLLLSLSCLSPVLSIYGGGSDVFQHAGSGAAGLFLGGIAVAVVWGICYAELASAFPYAGGDYVGVGAILGPGAAMASLASWIAWCGPATAFSAQTVAQYLGDLWPGLDAQAATFGSLAAALLVALLAVRTGALVTGIFLAIEMLAVLALAGAGLWHPVRGLSAVLSHPQMLDAAGVLVPASIGALALGGVNAAYNTVGGNQAMFFGEELEQPHRHLGGVIVNACMIGAFATALPVIFFVLGTADLAASIREAAPFSAFLGAVAGPAAGHALSAGVALAAFNCLIVQIMLGGRLFFSLGRDAISHPRANVLLARVHAHSGVPRNATLAAAALAAACCLLGSHFLLVFVAASTAYSFGLVSLAVLLGRRRRQTAMPGYWRSALFPLAPMLGLAATAFFFVGDYLDADNGRPSILINGAVILVALAWHRVVLRRRPGAWMPKIG